MDAPRPRMLDIDIETSIGKLKGRIGVPPGPIRLAELAFNFLPLDDRLISMATASDRKAGHAPSCKRGCTACCRQIIPVSPAEAWMLDDLLRSMPSDRQARLLEVFRHSRDRLETAGFGERYLQTAGSIERLAAMSVEYQGLDLDCPFLEEGACGIYAQRPAICREYLATTPAEDCSEVGEKPVRTVPMAASFTECLAKVSAMVMGGEPQVIPLVLALEWAEANREEGRKRYDPVAMLEAMFHFLGAPGRAG